MVEDQVRVEEEPLSTEAGEVVKVKVGGINTETLADLEAEPPAPVQSRVYVASAVGDTDNVPDVALLPDQSPLAVQEVALVEDQVNVAEDPVVIDVGDAEIVTVGGVAGVAGGV